MSVPRQWDCGVALGRGAAVKAGPGQMAGSGGDFGVSGGASKHPGRSLLCGTVGLAEPP